MAEGNGTASIRDVYAVQQRIEDKLDAVLKRFQDEHEKIHDQVDKKIDRLNWRWYIVAAGLLGGIVAQAKGAFGG